MVPPSGSSPSTPMMNGRPLPSVETNSQRNAWPAAPSTAPRQTKVRPSTSSVNLPFGDAAAAYDAAAAVSAALLKAPLDEEGNRIPPPLGEDGKPIHPPPHHRRGGPPPGKDKE